MLRRNTGQWQHEGGRTCLGSWFEGLWSIHQEPARERLTMVIGACGGYLLLHKADQESGWVVTPKSSWPYLSAPPLWSWQLGLMSKRVQPPKHPHHLGTECKHMCTNCNTPRDGVYKPCRTVMCWNDSYLLSPPLEHTSC